jgi:type II secretory pathway pseudopilin PulG
MQGGRGLTLVEVLVVTGIMAVGVAIMVPAVTVLRQDAAAAGDASNLQQIGQATLSYCADNNGYLPQWTEAGQCPWRWGPFLGYISSWYLDYNGVVGHTYYRQPPGNPNTMTDLGADILRLNIEGYLGKWNYVDPANGVAYPPTEIDLRIGFPPAGNRYPQLDLSYLPVRWNPAQAGTLTNGDEEFDSSYMFNPHWIFVNQAFWTNYYTNVNPNIAAGFPNNCMDLGINAQPVTNWYQKLSDYPSFAALACDDIWDAGSTAQLTNNGAVWSLLYPDGHVQQVVDSYVIWGLESNSNTETGPGGSVFSAADGRHGSFPNAGREVDLGPYATCDVMDDYLDILETEAQGRNPLESLLYPQANWNNDQHTPLEGRESASPYGTVLKGLSSNPAITVDHF